MVRKEFYMGRKRISIKKSAIKNAAKTQQPEKPKPFPITPNDKQEVEKFFSQSIQERVARLTAPDYEQKRHSKESISRLIGEFMDKNAPQLQYMVRYGGLEMSMMERGLIGMVQDWISTNAKKKYQAGEFLFNRQFGQAKQLQEITGANGQALLSSKKQVDLEDELSNMTKEERAEYVKIAKLKQSLIEKLSEKE